MIRILHSVSYMCRGGIETMLMNYYRNIDRTKVQFDFLCNSYLEGAYDSEILSLGGRIFRTPGFSPFKHFAYKKYIHQLFVEHPEYKIVEAHQDGLGVFALKEAKRANIPVRIYHAHSTSFPKNYKLPIKLYGKSLINKYTNINFACGKQAAKFFFGEDCIHNGDYHIINNAIDLSKFKFNPEIRKSVRSRYGFTDELVIGHIGRFATVKNHSRIIRIFQALKKTVPRAKLVLVGEGELFSDIQNTVRSTGLTNDVIMTGSIPNPEIWYQAFDIFLMPSLYEGLPVTGIEAQTADLPCLFSSSISPEVLLSDKAHFMDLKCDDDLWAKKIIEISSDIRVDKTDLISSKNFNITIEASKLQNYYMSLITDL